MFHCIENPVYSSFLMISIVGPAVSRGRKPTPLTKKDFKVSFEHESRAGVYLKLVTPFVQKIKNCPNATSSRKHSSKRRFLLLSLPIRSNEKIKNKIKLYNNNSEKASQKNQLYIQKADQQQQQQRQQEQSYGTSEQQQLNLCQRNRNL